MKLETAVEPTDGVEMIWDAIVEHWGEECSDYEPGCPCCDVWATFRKAFPDWKPTSLEEAQP